MADVVIREATPADVPDILRIAERGWNATYGDILPQETIDSTVAEWYESDTMTARIEEGDSTYLVAVRADEVLGYAQFAPAEDEGVATLAALYVHPDRWRTGVGSALLAAVESRCRDRGYESLRFRVLSGNEIGSSFYRKHGYEPVEERETELSGYRARERVFCGRIA